MVGRTHRTSYSWSASWNLESNNSYAAPPPQTPHPLPASLVYCIVIKRCKLNFSVQKIHSVTFSKTKLDANHWGLCSSHWDFAHVAWQELVMLSLMQHSISIMKNTAFFYGEVQVIWLITFLVCFSVWERGGRSRARKADSAVLLDTCYWKSVKWMVKDMLSSMSELEAD